MRILLLSGEYPPGTGFGGIGTYTQVLGRALVTLGHEVHVLACFDRQVSSDTSDEGVVVHRRPLLRVRGFGVIGAETGWRVRTAASVGFFASRLAGRFDVIEAPEWLGEGALLSLRRALPMVVHLHTPGVIMAEDTEHPSSRDVRWSSKVERLAVRRASAVTAPSRMLVDELDRRGWLDRPVEVVRNPIDPTPWLSLPPPSGAGATVLVLGRLEARKAPELVVDALSLLRADGLDVNGIFVGRSNGTREGVSYGEWLRARAEATAAPVSFLDHVDRERLPAVMAEAQVVAVPSRFDNFPMVALEAMAAGRPIVSSERVGTTEIAPGVAKAVPAEAAAFADALRLYFQSPDLADADGKQLREAVQRSCAPVTIALQRARLYAAAAA